MTCECTIDTPATTAATAPAEHAATDTREEGRHLMPPVDIFETDDALTVVADVPGATKDSIEVRVDDGVLTLRARQNRPVRGDATYSEFGLMDFFRQFQLGERIDPTKIDANLRHGVLTLRLPKVEKARPRKIAINVN